MGRYIIRRLLQALLLLALLSVGMFALIHLLPGGPEQVIFNPRLSAAGRAALRARFGLDQPVYLQYLKWLGNALIGNFGFSFADNQPVSNVIVERFPATLELFSTALALALIIAIPIGVLSAVRQGTVTDYTLTTLAYFGISMPIFQRPNSASLLPVSRSDIWANNISLKCCSRCSGSPAFTLKLW